MGGSYGEVGYWTQPDSVIDFLGRMGQGQLSAKYKFANGYLLKEEAKLRPYVYLGVGAANFAQRPGSEANRINPETAFTANAGAGLTFMITKNVSLTYNLGYIWNNADGLDFVTRNSNEQVLQHGLSVGINVGKPKDDDMDGIPNFVDQCPGTPTAVSVDLIGCPTDKDMDGIADYQDACPDVKGIATFNGCPDSDNDGIKDSEDACPNVAGVAALKGCPDVDGDGITDADDKCPNEKGTAANQGCPDSDGDGVLDKDDACPTVKGLKTLNGCPDTDGDGVADKDDACPTVKGLATNKGCPEVKEEVKKLFAQALTGIQFETGKDIIKKNSFAILDQVVKVMMDNPEYKLNIFGHTDNQGDDAKNMDLSQRRANAVQKYLVDKGVPSNRIISVKGFGETQPVADNTTTEGRAKNRRVEFKVEF